MTTVVPSRMRTSEDVCLMSTSGAVELSGPLTVSTSRVITGEISIVTQPSSAIWGVSDNTVPMVMDVGVLSSSGRRYLEILGKLDQLMPLLQTLEIHEVATPEGIDRERAALKRRVRELASSARSLAGRLRRQMNALDARGSDGSSAVQAADDAADPAANQMGVHAAAAAATTMRTESVPQAPEQGVSGVPA